MIRKLRIYFLLQMLVFSGFSQNRIFEFEETDQIITFLEFCYFHPVQQLTSGSPDVPLINANYILSDSLDLEKLGSQYWMHFSIKNGETQGVNIELFPGLSEQLDLFIGENGNYQKYPIGSFENRKIVRPFAGPGKTFLSKIEVHLEAGEQTNFYAYFNHKSRGFQAKRDSQIAPRLISSDIWYSKVKLSNIIWSFVFGCFAILFLYHIVYYFQTWDRVYLYFCLFVFSIAFPFLVLIADVFNTPESNILIFFSVSGFFTVFYFQLTRKLINLKELLPGWDRILKYFIIIKIIVVLTYSLLHIMLSDFFVILALYFPSLVIELILLVFLAIALVKTKDRISIWFVIGSFIAWAGLTIVIILNDPNTSFTAQMDPVSYASPAYGFVLQSLFFALVLSYRARLNEVEKKKAKDDLILQLQENKQLQEKVNRELEEKVRERTKLIEQERQKSEKLLLNLLPKAIAKELKDTGTTVPKRFDNVTVLFADFVGFTRISQRMNPEAVVNLLDYYFRHFDSIMAEFGLEKIKTIGDAYMSVCGLPNPNEHHVFNSIKAALKMQKFLNSEAPQDIGTPKNWELRIGIHTGPVVAGVIGEYKFAYDVWGDTVNMASRLEQYSMGGKVNVSKEVYEVIKDSFVCQSRGLIEVKGKGNHEMFFVEGEKNKEVG